MSCFRQFHQVVEISRFEILDDAGVRPEASEIHQFTFFILRLCFPQDAFQDFFGIGLVVNCRSFEEAVVTHRCPDPQSQARWAGRRGFRTAIVECHFRSDFRVAADDPDDALCGVDNALARAALEDVGFGRIQEQ